MEKNVPIAEIFVVFVPNQKMNLEICELYLKSVNDLVNDITIYTPKQMYVDFCKDTPNLSSNIHIINKQSAFSKKTYRDFLEKEISINLKQCPSLDPSETILHLAKIVANYSIYFNSGYHCRYIVERVLANISNWNWI